MLEIPSAGGMASNILVPSSPNWYGAQLLAISGDNAYAAYASHNTITIIDVHACKVQACLAGHPKRVTCIGFVAATGAATLPAEDAPDASISDRGLATGSNSLPLDACNDAAPSTNETAPTCIQTGSTAPQSPASDPCLPSPSGPTPQLPTGSTTCTSPLVSTEQATGTAASGTHHDGPAPPGPAPGSTRAPSAASNAATKTTPPAASHGSEPDTPELPAAAGAAPGTPCESAVTGTPAVAATAPDTAKQPAVAGTQKELPVGDAPPQRQPPQRQPPLVLLSGSEDGTLRAWDVLSGACMRAVSKKKCEICALLPLPGTSGMAVAADAMCRLLTWQHSGATAKPQILPLKTPTKLSCMEACPHHPMRVLLGAIDGSAMLLDVEGGVLLSTFKPHRGPIHTLHWLPFPPATLPPTDPSVGGSSYPSLGAPPITPAGAPVRLMSPAAAAQLLAGTTPAGDAEKQPCATIAATDYAAAATAAAAAGEATAEPAAATDQAASASSSASSSAASQQLSLPSPLPSPAQADPPACEGGGDVEVPPPPPPLPPAPSPPPPQNAADPALPSPLSTPGPETTAAAPAPATAAPATRTEGDVDNSARTPAATAAAAGSPEGAPAPGPVPGSDLPAGPQSPPQPSQEGSEDWVLLDRGGGARGWRSL